MKPTRPIPRHRLMVEKRHADSHRSRNGIGNVIEGRWKIKKCGGKIKDGPSVEKATKGAKIRCQALIDMQLPKRTGRRLPKTDVILHMSDICSFITTHFKRQLCRCHILVDPG